MKNKKDLLGGVIIVVLLLLVLVTYMSFYNYNKLEEKRIKEDMLKDNSLFMIDIYNDYTSLKIEDKTNIDTNKIVLGSYNCKSDDCEVYNNSSINNVYDNKFIILKEHNKIFIYDFTLNKVVSDLYDDIIYVLNDNYYIVKENDKYGIISKSGVNIIDLNYDEILYDDIYNSYIKVKNNKLYGLVDLDNGNVVVNTKYEDIRINDYNYYSVLKDNLWYVIDNKENIITNGYEYTFAFGKGFIALVDNSLQILKYNKEENELLNSEIIPVYEENGYEIERTASNIEIKIRNGDDIIKYQYNINRNSLVNK